MQTLISEWRLNMLENGKSENTIRVYISDLRIYLDFLAHDELDTVKIDEILDYRNWLIETFPRTTTMRRISSLRMFYTFLTELGIKLDFEPSQIAQLSFERITPIWLSNEQMTMLVNWSNENQSRIAIAIRILLQTAIKKSELLSLSIDKVDKLDKTILIDIYPNHMAHKNRTIDCDYTNAIAWVLQNNITNRTLEYDVRSVFDVLYGLDFDSNVTWESLRWNVIAQWYDNGDNIQDIQERLGVSNATIDQVVSILESR